MENNNERDKKNSVLIEVIDGGPIKITGNFILKDLKRDFIDIPNEVYLCRCGQSLNKPYCDKTHLK